MKIEKIKQTDLRLSANKDAMLLKDLWIYTKVLNDRLLLEEDRAVAFKIPKGFNTDGASVPRLFWAVIDRFDWEILVPAIVHDWCWRNGFVNGYIYNINTQEVEKEIGTIPLTLQEGNLIMLDKMRSFYCGFIKRYFVFFILNIVADLRK